MPSNGDLVASIGVSKVCTRTLVSIEYGAKILTRNLASCRLLLLAEVEQQRTRPNELVGADDGGSVAVAAVPAWLGSTMLWLISLNVVVTIVAVLSLSTPSLA